MQLPCYGKYRERKLLCWFCWCIECKVETESRQEPVRVPETREQNPGSRLASRMEAALNSREHEPYYLREASPEPHVQRGNPMRPATPVSSRCYGEYDDSIACSYCGYKTECFNHKYGAVSSNSLEPTDSAAVDTGATRVGEESNMDSKEFEARKTKALKLEVVSVSDDFMVKSSTRQGGYMVTPKEGGGYHCACMDFALHRSDPEWKCKHIIAVDDYLERRGPTNGDSRFDLLDLK